MMDMLGYKATHSNMRCRDYYFKLGKRHTQQFYPILCIQGFHFCENIIDVFKYYAIKDMRIFKVKASGNIIHDADKSVTNVIELLEELSWNDIIVAIMQLGRYINLTLFNKILELTTSSYKLDQLYFNYVINDSWSDRHIFSTYLAKWGKVHAFAAFRNYAINYEFVVEVKLLDLFNHTDYKVRRDLAQLGWNNDAYLNDRHNRVRNAASRYKLGLK